MKNLFILLFFGLIIVSAETSNAQTQQQQLKDADKATVIPANERINSDNRSPAVLSETPAAVNQRDASGRTYMIVEGRKVYVDDNGVQSLSVPTEIKKETVPVKEKNNNPEN